jgi:phage-related protein
MVESQRWFVEMFESPDEGRPVEEFLVALDRQQRQKVVAVIRMLQEQGPTLPFPYSSQLRGRLRELRAHYGRTHYRVLYFGAPNRAFVLLHAFQKRSGRVPEGDIATGERRMAACLRTLRFWRRHEED